MKRKKKLNLTERLTVYVMRGQGYGIREISRDQRRSPSTISRELKRNCHPDIRVWLAKNQMQRAHYAHEVAKSRNLNRTKAEKLSNKELLDYLLDKLSNEQWSPEQISESMANDLNGKKVSAKTIYNWIKKHRPELKRHLRQRGIPRRQRVANRRGIFRCQEAAPEKRSIQERPEMVQEHVEFGHWEGDTMVSKKSKNCILSLRELASRQRFYLGLPNLESETIIEKLLPFFSSLPEPMRKTITFDRGTEFAQFIKLEKTFKDLFVYFCDAYKPYQKGSVENSNKDFRWYHPKGTDFSKIPQEEVSSIMNKINNRPMRCLQYPSADQVFTEALFKLAA